MHRQPRLFADSADVNEVGELLADRLVYGVTTNPTILERAGRSVRDIPDLYARWEAEGAREIFFQTWGESIRAMLDNARPLVALGELVVVKVPATRDGFAVASELVAEGVTVLVTAVYTPAQALVAATIGARYIAPYLGRIQDAGRDGIAEVCAMQALVDGSRTDVLAASLRTPAAIVALAGGGVRFFTAAPAVIIAAVSDDVSVAAAADFEAAATRIS